MFRFLTLLISSVSMLAAQVVVLSHVRLIDGSGAAPVEDATIVMAEGKIREIGPSANVKIPSGAEVRELRDKTVVPGIINLHGHVGNVKGIETGRELFTRENVLRNLGTYAKYGVTTTTSMGTDEDLMIEIRDDIRQGRERTTRVFTALQGFTSRQGYPTQAPGVKGVAQEVFSAAQSRAWVDGLADKHADVVKMWVDSHHGEFNKLSPSLYGAIIAQAHKRGLLAFAHVYELADAKGLVDAGIDVLAHSVRDQEVDAELISKMKEKGTFYIPTMARELTTFAYAESPAWLDDPFFLEDADPAAVEGVKTTIKAAQSDPKLIAQGKSDLAMAMKNVKKLWDAGVNVAFGTDTGPAGRFPGYLEHMEAKLMIEAGLTPAQVIEAWSKRCSEALRIDKEFGTLAKGKAADLVVLDADPLADILNTRKIHAVYIAGAKIN